MTNKLLRFIFLPLAIASLIITSSGFAANTNSESKKGTPDSTVSIKDLAVSKSSNVDLKAIRNILENHDKALNNNPNLAMSMQAAASSSYGSAWSYSSTSSTTINCYGYASNFRIWLNPGDVAFYYGSPIGQGATPSVDTVASYVLQDLGRWYYGKTSRIISSATATVNSDEYRIAVRVGQDSVAGYDYHFMLQCSNGTWCEKHGDGASKNDGAINPSTFNWNLYYKDGTLYKRNFYNSSTVYIAVKR